MVGKLEKPKGCFGGGEHKVEWIYKETEIDIRNSKMLGNGKKGGIVLWGNFSTVIRKTTYITMKKEEYFNLVIPRLRFLLMKVAAT